MGKERINVNPTGWVVGSKGRNNGLDCLKKKNDWHPNFQPNFAYSILYSFRDLSKHKTGLHHSLQKSALTTTTHCS